MKKRVVCYGDSNTWGYNPMGGRYDEADRWPMVMQAELGEAWHVIEEGLNARTFSQDDPTEGGFKSGAEYLPVCLATNNPVDLVIVMLGTNDAKARFGLNAVTIAHNINETARLIRAFGCDGEGAPPRILIVSPPLIGENLGETMMFDHFGADAPGKSRGFAEAFNRYARLNKCAFLDAAQCVKPCKQDAIHLTRESQRALGAAMAAKVREIIKEV